MHAAVETTGRLGTHTPGFIASSSPSTVKRPQDILSNVISSLIQMDRKDNFVNFNLEPLHRQLASSVIINNPSQFQIYRTPFQRF